MRTERNPVGVAIVGILVILAVLVGAFTLPDVLRGGTTYRAEFPEAAGLQSGDLVTVAGVEAGRVGSVELDGDHVLVAFTVSGAWVGNRTSASIQVKTLLGAKYLALDPQGDEELAPGAVIPRERTASPFDVVEAFNGLSATVDALDTDQLAESLDTLADTFRGTAPEVRGALEGLSRLSRTIAGRDEEIRRLLGGTRDLSTVLADRNAEFEALLRDGNLLLDELRRRSDAISALIDGTRELAEQLRGLVADNSAELTPTLESLDRVAAILERNRDALAAGLRDQAPFVRLFANAVGNGRWFDAYICGLVLPPLGGSNEGGC